MQINLQDIDEREAEELKAIEEAKKLERAQTRYKRRFEGHKLPFLIRHKDTAKISFWASIFFNLLSAAGLWYAVHVMLEFVPIPYFNDVMATVVLVGFEITKRKFSDKFWDYWWARRQIHWVNGAINFVLLFGISMSGTLYGLYYAAKDGAPEAQYIGAGDDPAATATLAKLDEAKAALLAFNDDPSNYVGGQVTKKNGDKGQIYYKKLDSQSELQANVAKWETTLQENFGIIRVDNAEIKSEWKARTQSRIISILCLAIICEILFEICMRFNSKYEWEKYVTLIKPSVTAKVATPKPNHSTSSGTSTPSASGGPSSSTGPTSSYAVATDNLELEIGLMQYAFKWLKKDQDAWKTKNRQGKGTKATNDSHIEKNEQEMLYIQEKLSALGATV